MLESARKGFWNPTETQLKGVAGVHAEVTADHGAPCTEFVCGNKKLQEFITSSLEKSKAERYRKDIDAAVEERAGSQRLKAESKGFLSKTINSSAAVYIAIAAVVLLFIFVMLKIRLKRKE